MAGQPHVADDAKFAFERALRTVLEVAASCAGLGGIVGWLTIGQTRAARTG
jgi:hypothetical protein